MSKVLFIRSNPVSPDPRVEKEARALGRFGYDVEILAWDRSCENPEFEDKECYKIRRIKLRAPYGRPRLLLCLMIWTIYELIYLIRNDFDIIHSCDLDTLLPAVIVSKLKNKILFYDSFDFYADCLPNNIPSIIRSAIAQIEIFFAGLANYVIIADESRKNQFNNSIKNAVIIYNSPEDISYDDRMLFNLNKTDFVIFYAGILDKTRGIKQMIDAIDEFDDTKLIIAGFGVDEHEILEMCKHAKNAEFLGKIRYDSVIKNTLQSNLLFALYDPHIPNNRYASPNKLFEAMMCGKPIIVSDESSMANIVSKQRCGIVVPYGDIQAIRNAILKLKNDRSLCEELGNNGRKAYREKYSWIIMKRRLINIYNTYKNK